MSKSKYSYNLLNESWIPVIYIDDHHFEEISLRTLFAEMEKISEIQDESLIFEFGLYRFLIALVMDIFEFNEEEKILEMIDNKTFTQKNLDLIEKYFLEYSNRFDLFDEKSPFLQGELTPKIKKKRKKAVINLVHQIPHGSNVILFNHLFENEQQFSPKVCAKGLISIPPFTVMGGRGLSPGINGAPPIYVLIRGQNLFDTIMFNSYPPSSEISKSIKSPWLRDKPVEYHSKVHVKSKLDGFTFLARYVHLFPQSEGVCSYSNKISTIVVKKIIYEGGYSLKDEGEWTDPNVAYRFYGKKKRRVKFRMSEDKPLWRDYGPLLLYKNGTYKTKNGKTVFYCPDVIRRFSEWVEDNPELADDQVQVNLYGVRTDLKAKIFEWKKAEMNIPKDLLKYEFGVKLVKDCMEIADTVNSFLQKSIDLIGKKKEKKKKKKKKKKY